MEAISTEFYNFEQWENCFKHYYELEELFGADNIRLVISEHSYCSGYWIEDKNVVVDSDPRLYHFYSGQEVKDLEARVRKEVAKRAKTGIHNGLIL